MKKSEIKVGGEYFQDRYQDWGQTEWNCTRVRVVSTQVANWKWDHIQNKHVAMSSSSYATVYGVRVVELDKKTGEPKGNGHEKVVTMASLRGEWTKVYAERSRKWGEKKAAAAAYQKEMADKQRKITEIVNAGQALIGLKHVTQYGSAKVAVSGDVFQQMITFLADMGWKPEEQQ